MIISLLSIVSINSTPYYDFISRIQEYKARAVETTGCGLWQDVLRLYEGHEKYCEEGILSKVAEFDDFEMAAFSWIVTREWNNPLLSENLKVIVKREDVNNILLC